jgi:methylated-DNA-[protein]-cysteine S-methyltransferase
VFPLCGISIVRAPTGEVKLDTTRFAILELSLGNILVVSKNDRLIRLDVSKKGRDEIRKAFVNRYAGSVESEPSFRKVRLLLDRYLKGARVDFDVDVDIEGMGNFTRRVLFETKAIPYGEVRSYLWIGRKLGYLNASRAVGQAMKRNPIPIIIPCHRVIKQDGTIGGFSMEGVSKEDLLKLEGVRLREVK